MMNTEKQQSESTSSDLMLAAATSSAGQEDHGQQAVAAAAAATHYHDLPPLPEELRIEFFYPPPPPLTPHELHACSFGDVGSSSSFIGFPQQQLAEHGVNAIALMDDIDDVPLGLPFTIYHSVNELMKTLYTFATQPDYESLSGVPGQGIHGHGSPAASGGDNPDSILAHLNVGSIQDILNPSLGDQFMGCDPGFRTGGLSASNPTHGSLILADQCRIPAESELGKGYHGGAGTGRESPTPDYSQANTNPIKRRVGRPKGSSSKNPSRELKGPAAIQLTLHEIRIGPWKKTNETGCDLLAKCYFGHRKLIWEVLCHETKLKSRMEVDWKHILSMKTSSPPDEHGEPNELIMLQLELSQPPGFSHETKVISNKHSSWGACGDFTSGIASSYRIHDLVFKTRLFCDNFHKMLEKSRELRELSQKQFPTLASTRFEACNSGALVQPGGSNPAMQMFDPPAPSGFHSFQPIAQPFVNVEGIFYQSPSDDRLPCQAPSAAAAPIQNNLPGGF